MSQESARTVQSVLFKLETGEMTLKFLMLPKIKDTAALLRGILSFSM